MWCEATADELKSLTDGLCNPVFVVEAGAGTCFPILSINKCFEDTTGWRQQDVVGRCFGDLLPVPDRGDARAGFVRCATSGEPVEYERRWDSSSGARWWRTNLTPVHGGDGRVARLLGNCYDITARKESLTRAQLNEARTERKFRESEKRLRMIADNLPALISVIGDDLRYQFVNRRYGEVLGVDAQELVGESVAVIGRHLDQSLQPYYLRVLRGERVTFESSGRFAGVRRHAQVTLVPDFGDDGAVRRFYALSVDITDRKERELLLEQQVQHDGLTGLLNRNGFMTRLQPAMEHAKRYGEPLALLFLDLDGFKHINDTYGHNAGDALLRGFAGRLTGVMRRTDAVARLAGDEFVVLLEGVTNPIRDPATAATKVLDAMKLPLPLAGGDVIVSASIGIAVYSDDIVDAESLLQRADKAMYRAKHVGKNGYCVI